MPLLQKNTCCASSISLPRNGPQLNHDLQLKNIGEECPACMLQIKPGYAISVCQCKKYGHYLCLLQQLEIYQFDQKHNIVCRQCGAMISCELSISEYRLKIKIYHVLFLLMAVSLIIFGSIVQITKIKKMIMFGMGMKQVQFIEIFAGFLCLLIGSLLTAYTIHIILHGQIWKISDLDGLVYYPETSTPFFQQSQSDKQQQNLQINESTNNLQSQNHSCKDPESLIQDISI